MNEFTKRVAEGGTGTRNVNGTRSRFTCAETCTQEFPKNFLQRVPDGVPVASVTERHPVECSRANVLCLDGLMTRWTTDEQTVSQTEPRLKRALLYHLSYAPTADSKKDSTPAVHHYVPCTQEFPKNFADGGVIEKPTTYLVGQNSGCDMGQIFRHTPEKGRNKGRVMLTAGSLDCERRPTSGSPALPGAPERLECESSPEVPTIADDPRDGNAFRGVFFGLLFSLPFWALAAYEWYRGVMR